MYACVSVCICADAPAERRRRIDSIQSIVAETHISRHISELLVVRAHQIDAALNVIVGGVALVLCIM